MALSPRRVIHVEGERQSAIETTRFVKRHPWRSGASRLHHNWRYGEYAGPLSQPRHNFTVFTMWYVHVDKSTNGRPPPSHHIVSTPSFPFPVSIARSSVFCLDELDTKISKLHLRHRVRSHVYTHSSRGRRERLEAKTTRARARARARTSDFLGQMTPKVTAAKLPHNHHDHRHRRR